jgi:hypothetical protein
MSVKIKMHEPHGGRQISTAQRGFFPVQLVLSPGRQLVNEETFKIMSKNCERLKGALQDGEVQVVGEKGNENLIVDFRLPASIIYRCNKYVIPANQEVTLSDEEFDELRQDERFRAALSDLTIEFLGRE